MPKTMSAARRRLTAPCLTTRPARVSWHATGLGARPHISPSVDVVVFSRGV